VIDLDQYDRFPASLGCKEVAEVPQSGLSLARLQRTIKGGRCDDGVPMSDDSVSGALTAIQEGQQRLAVSLERLGDDMLSRMDRVDSAVAAIRDDITVTMRLADRAQEAADQTRGELSALGDRVRAMMHQIQDLQSDVRRLKGEGPRTEQPETISRGVAR
jgi:hypothetical protein